MSEVLTRRAGDVSIVTLNVPERRNALSSHVLAAVQAAIPSQVEQGARAIVLTGASRCFSAGADLRELTGSLRDADFDAAVARAADAIRQASAPVIAAIEGPCIGAALELAVACDVRVAAERSFFELPATRLGLLYRPAAVMDLGRAMSMDLLTRLILMGERISPADARSGGFVSIVTAEGGAERAAVELGVSSARGVQRAVAATKALLVDLRAGARDLSGWEDLREELLASDERAAALRAARDRSARAP
jgi:enoyl-CoA hydratase